MLLRVPWGLKPQGRGKQGILPSRELTTQGYKDNNKDVKAWLSLMFTPKGNATAIPIHIWENYGLCKFACPRRLRQNLKPNLFNFRGRAWTHCLVMGKIGQNRVIQGIQLGTQVGLRNPCRRSRSPHQPPNTLWLLYFIAFIPAVPSARNVILNSPKL